MATKAVTTLHVPRVIARWDPSLLQAGMLMSNVATSKSPHTFQFASRQTKHVGFDGIGTTVGVTFPQFAGSTLKMPLQAALPVLASAANSSSDANNNVLGDLDTARALSIATTLTSSYNDLYLSMLGGNVDVTVATHANFIDALNRAETYILGAGKDPNAQIQVSDALLAPLLCFFVGHAGQVVSPYPAISKYVNMNMGHVEKVYNDQQTFVESGDGEDWERSGAEPASTSSGASSSLRTAGEKGIDGLYEKLAVEDSPLATGHHQMLRHLQKILRDYNSDPLSPTKGNSLLDRARKGNGRMGTQTVAGSVSWNQKRAR